MNGISPLTSEAFISTLQKIITERKLDVVDIAAKSNLTLGNVHRILHGAYNPKLDHVIAIMNAATISLTEIAKELSVTSPGAGV